MDEVEHRLREAGFKDFDEYFDLLVKFAGSHEKLAGLLDEKEIMRNLIQRLGLEGVQQVAQESPSVVK